ncbi:unnamed protein product [Ilex paraguariensis]|uniref:Uncharacterized protein n=1 Tax=Ilex paraguariensis TaxID=185542 RepID=A0ABC8SMI0_9AQUA
MCDPLSSSAGWNGSSKESEKKRKREKVIEQFKIRSVLLSSQNSVVLPFIYVFLLGELNCCHLCVLTDIKGDCISIIPCERSVSL